MQLSELLVDTKAAWVEYPGYEGFEVEVANLSKPELISLRKRCIIPKFDKKTHRPVEELDEDKFVKEFTKATIKGWKGFKLKYLEEFILVDLTGKDPNAELPYSRESAQLLVKNSTEFDTWINDTVFDLDNFRTIPKGTDVETSGDLEQ